MPLTQDGPVNPDVIPWRTERAPKADDYDRPRSGANAFGLLERFYKATLALILTALWLPVIVILARRSAKRTLLAIALLGISFQIQKHLFLQEDAANLGSLGGLQVSLTNIALTGLCLAKLVEAVTSPRALVSPQRTRNLVLIPASLLVIFYLISLFAAGDVRLALFQVCSVVAFYCLYLYVAETVKSRADVLFIVRVLLIGAIGQSSLMLAQARGLVGEIQFYFIRTQAGTFRDGRVMGTLGSPNMAAAYLAMIMLLALGLILAHVPRIDKLLAVISFSMAAMSLILTESRGAWVSLVVGLVTMMIFGGRRVALRIGGGIIIGLCLFAIPFKHVIVERLSGDDNGAAASRISLNQIALLMIEDHPISGVGANNYALFMTPYAARSGRIGEFRYTVHNTYFLTCAEIGICGLIAFVWFLIAIVCQGINCWHLHDPLCSPLALGCAVAIIGFMFQLSVDIFRTGSAIDLLWLFGGLVTAMSRMNPGRSPVPMCGPNKAARLIEYGFERPHRLDNEGQS